METGREEKVHLGWAIIGDRYLLADKVAQALIILHYSRLEYEKDDKEWVKIHENV